MFLSTDQSSNKSGWVVFYSENELIDYGIIDLSKLPKFTDQEQAHKRFVLLENIDALVDEYRIKQINTEGIYYNNNVDSYRKLAQIQGCIQDYCVRKGIMCFSFRCAGEWRKHLGIKAKKKEEYKLETKKYVVEKYAIPDNLEEDIYDAIGIGVAYYKLLE